MVFGANRRIDPKSFEDYLAIGGYQALVKALFEMTPEQVSRGGQEVNLRGRGGGGFPAGRQVGDRSRNAPGETKYVVVNCDEGDPGRLHGPVADGGQPPRRARGPDHRSVRHRRPRGLCLRPPGVPLALENLTASPSRRPKNVRLLGTNILGSGFDFQVKVHRGRRRLRLR